MWPREKLTPLAEEMNIFLFVCEVSGPAKAIKVMLSQSVNLATLFCNKCLYFTTALLESAVGKEWLEKLFHDQISTKDVQRYVPSPHPAHKE